MTNYTINTDGGSRGNPGPSACAFIARNNKRILAQGSYFLGNKTNNEAEYYGVILALKWLEKQSLKETDCVTFILDSELVVKQLNGIYKVKDLRMKKFVTYIHQHLKNLSIVYEFLTVERAKNKDADWLVNECLDSQK